MSVNAADLVVRKTLHVAVPVERAWEVFTARLNDWWPVRSHSIAEDRVQELVLEGRAGGRMFERTVDGDEGYWGTVVAWEPPRRLVMSWHVNPERPEPTEWEVLFEPEGDGTRVEFEHRGFERYDDAAEASAGYTKGWDIILGNFGEAAER
jgi:uncharacterized protein YndB with AHSA1/START domain